MQKTILWVVVAVVILAGGWLLYASVPNSAESGPIKVGFIAPLTGDVASIGESMKNTVALAVEEINAAGGVGGRQIEVIYEDGKCTGPVAASAAQKLISVDKVRYVLGGACSGETLGAAPIAEQNKVILFSSVSSSPDITTAGDYIFRNFASDSTTGKKIAEAIAAKGYKKVAVIAEETDYSQALKKVFEQKFTELGGTIADSEGYTSATRDFRTQLAKIKAAAPDALYLVPQSPQSGEVLLQQLRTSGIKAPKYSNELVTTESFLTSGISEGIIYAEVSFDKDAPASKAFFDKYVAKYGSLDTNTPPVYIASQYDTVFILKETIEKYGDDVEKVKNGLYQIQGRLGVSGSLTMDRNGDAVKEYVLKVIRNGKSEIYTQ